jgi:hypothetical protein
MTLVDAGEAVPSFVSPRAGWPLHADDAPCLGGTMGDQHLDRKWDRCAALAFLGGLVVSIGGAVLVMILCPQPPWTDLRAFVSAYHPLQSFIFVPSLVLPLSIVAVLAGLHAGARPEEKRWSSLALAFGIVGATLVCINYLVQGVFVPALVEQGSEVVGNLASANPRSLFWVLEMFGYGIVGVAMWTTAPLFRGPGVDRVLRWLLVVNGAGSSLAAVAVAVDSSWVLGPPGLAVVLAWNVLMVVLAVLLVRRSRHPAR